MNAQTMINQVRRQLVETTAAFWSDSELLTLINEAERDFHNKVRVLESRAVMSTIAGRADYPLPSNWLSARAIFFNNPNSSTPTIDAWYRLRPTNLEKQAQEQPGFLSDETNTRGKPRRYWLWDRSLFLDPVPDIDGDSNVYMFFKSKPIPLVSAVYELNTDDSLSDAIESYVLWKAWKKEKEYDLAAEAKQNYDNGVREGRRWAKKESGDQKYKLDIESGLAFGSIGGLSFPPL